MRRATLIAGLRREYAAASASFGEASGIGFMVAIARGEVWLGFAE